MTDRPVLHEKEAKVRIAANIIEHGFHIACIDTDGYSPAFAYTIGLNASYQHPEIIVFGLQLNVLNAILRDMATRVKEGERFESHRSYTDVLEGYDVQFLEVDKQNVSDHLGFAGWYYGGHFEFPVLQMIWPDKESNWPWEEAFNPNFLYSQPLLDRNMSFKFREDRNLRVYTTKHFSEGKPILYVFHDEDGEWQFHTEYEPQPEDGIVLCLHHIIDKDPTINALFQLNVGESAYREDEKSSWVFEREPCDYKDDKPSQSLWQKMKTIIKPGK